MNKRKTIIHKDKIKRKKFIKTEIKRLILQSIIQNFQGNEIIRLKALKKMAFLQKKGFISKQNNMCLLTGRLGGVFSMNDLSRHSTKRISKLNMLHNFKIKSW